MSICSYVWKQRRTQNSSYFHLLLLGREYNIKLCRFENGTGSDLESGLHEACNRKKCQEEDRGSGMLIISILVIRLFYSSFIPVLPRLASLFLSFRSLSRLSCRYSQSSCISFWVSTLVCNSFSYSSKWFHYIRCCLLDNVVLKMTTL